MERERKVSQELKAQVASLKKAMDDSVAACSTAVQNAALESQRLHGSHELLTTQLLHAQQRDRDAQSDLTQLHAQWRRDEEEWKLASALAEQKLRNEILHLGSQLEKCRLLSTSQETEWLASLAREQSTIKELELAAEATRASMATAERLVVTERDQLKQQLLAANERVTAERETAQQLETQLRAVQQELQRVVASSDTERAAFRQLNDALAMLKLQLAHQEKAHATLASDRADVHEQLDKSNDLVRLLRAEIAALENKAETNAADTETHKLEYARELEKLRLEHDQSINRMQRNHQKTLGELKQQHATYVEYLQQQISEAAAATQQGRVEMDAKLCEVETKLARTTRQLQEGSDELQVRIDWDLWARICLAFDLNHADLRNFD
jgi:chromosome segregation ATPase